MINSVTYIHLEIGDPETTHTTGNNLSIILKFFVSLLAEELTAINVEGKKMTLFHSSLHPVYPILMHPFPEVIHPEGSHPNPFPISTSLD